jgi:hypothetical protein
MKTIKAIFIDAEKRSLSYVEVGDDYRAINAMIGCKEHTMGAHLSGNYSRGFEAVYASDDHIEDAVPSPQWWFQVDADKDPPSSYPIAGNGLVMGTDPQGAGCDTTVTIEELLPRITFTRRKFLGFHTRKTPTGIAVTMDAPILHDIN